ncbi:MAG: cysteine hydrolase family protein [Gammaproteobacteria bacterium]
MKKALLVIDYINGIAENGTCAAYLRERPEVIANTNTLIKIFRQYNYPIYFIRLAFDASYEGLPNYAPNAKMMRENKKFLLGSSDVEFITSLYFNIKEDFVFDKKYGDPFYGNSLLETLKSTEIDEVVLTGLSTENALLYGAATAMINNFKVTLIQDACGAPTQQQHEAAIALMKGRTINAVLNTQEFLTEYKYHNRD